MRRVGLGAGSKLGAELVGRAAQFLLIYLTQRVLGPEGFGQFTFAVAVGIVLMPVTDLGLQLTVTQHIARRRNLAPLVTGAGLSVKLVLAAAACGVLAVVALGRPPAVRLATFGLGLAMILASFLEFFGYAFRGLQRVEIDAAITLGSRLVTVAVGIWALLSGYGLTGLAVAYLAGNATGTAAGYWWLRARYFTPRLTRQLGAWRPLVARALPLGGAIVLSIAYTRTAVFLLDALEGPASVGMYGVAQRLTEPLAIIPAALMAAVFPAFVEARDGRGVPAAYLRTRSLGVLAAVGTVIATAGFAGGPWLLTLLYGEQYGGAIVSFQILAVAVSLTFVNYALTHFVIAHDLHRRYLGFTASVFVVHLVLCLLLIPLFGPAGAAGAVVASELLLLTLCWHALPRDAVPAFDTGSVRAERSHA